MIRVAKKEDIPYINTIGETFHNNFASLFHIETEIDSEFGIVLVNLKGNRINGYLYALDLGDNIDLLSIVVKEEDRRQNVGTELMEYLVDNYCYQDKTITLEVATNNLSAIRLYKKMGFVIVGTRKKYYNEIDAYTMRRRQKNERCIYFSSGVFL